MKQPEGLVRGLPNCGIVALAVALDLPYPKVFDEFRMFKGKQRNWRGRTYDEEIEDFLTLYGVKFEEIPRPRMTVKRWAHEEALPGIKYIVTSGSHVMFLQNGILIDQYSAQRIDDHRGNRLVVRRILKIYS
jgi:hypothetical protein